jgi:hypothetical protein
MMRGRIVLFVALAVVTALVGFYADWSTNTPEAVAEAPVPGSEPSRPSATRSPKRSDAPAAAPKGSAEKAAVPPASAPRPGAHPAGTTAQPGHKPGAPPASQPQRRTDPVRFGRVATSGANGETDIADDRRALTTTFSDLEVTVGNGAVTEPDATRSFSMTLPLTDGAKGETLRVHAQGFAFTQDGATARLTLRGGGRVTVKDIPTGSERDLLQTLELPASPATTYQLSADIELHQRDGTVGDGYLNILAIDIEIT